MIENEIKVLLTKNEYEYLLNQFGFERQYNRKVINTQKNYYYDTEDFEMNRQNKTCRIRIKDGKYTATIKKHLSTGNQSVENDIQLSTDLYHNAFVDMGLQLQGVLVTTRSVLLKDRICEVVLDRNEYLGTVDYELEIEYEANQQKNAHSILINILSMLPNQDIHFLESPISLYLDRTPSKSTRFFDRKKQIQS